MAPFSVTIDRTRLEHILRGSVFTALPSAVFKVRGPGALECMQGLLTNDLVGPGDNRLVYGATLTPKGGIVADYWVLRQSDGLVLITSPEGREPSAELFRRTLPPRLAKVEDLSDRAGVIRLFGDHSEVVMVESSVGALPGPPNAVHAIDMADQPVLVARGSPSAPFRGLIVGDDKAIDRIGRMLRDAGSVEGTSEDFHAARILAGWPALGLEIGIKTLPQEARYDELGGVSYTKGCYTGQEVVARVHFRGHTNREVRGLDWIDLKPLDGTVVRAAEREVGRVHSVLNLPDRRLGLATIRHTVMDGDAVMAAGCDAKVVPLPFDLPDVAA